MHPRPQMVERWSQSQDHLRWTFTLRPGLKWHDGSAVTAADCVASLKRWEPRDPLGRLLAHATAVMTADDDRSFTIVLNAPYPLMLDTLGKPASIVPFMMPAKLAETPPDAAITTVDGSGPFVFRADLWRPGNSMVFDRNPAYVARPEPPGFSGGRQGREDRPSGPARDPGHEHPGQRPVVGRDRLFTIRTVRLDHPAAEIIRHQTHRSGWSRRVWRQLHHQPTPPGRLPILRSAASYGSWSTKRR